MLGKEERQKGSLRCCLLHNSNLLTLYLALPPETAWACALPSSLCSFRQSGYFGVAVSSAIPGITTPHGTRAAARAVPGSLPCLAHWAEGECVGSKHCHHLLECTAPLAVSLCSCLSQPA